MNDKEVNSLRFRCLTITSKQNLKMRTQILILSGSILILLIPSLILAQIINMQYVTQILTNYMQTTMMMDMYNHLSMASKSFENQIGAFFLRSIKNTNIQDQIYLTNLNQLYWLQLKSDLIIKEKFYRFCEIDKITNMQEYNYSIPCVAYFAFLNYDYEPDDSIEQILRNHTNLVNSVALGLLGVDYLAVPIQIYFTSSVDDYTFGYYYPQIIRYSNYNPKQRIWYQQHFQNLEKNSSDHTQISQIYKYFLAEPVYSMSITQSMLNLERKVEGVYGTDLTFTNHIIPKIDINVMIVERNGQLLLTNYKNKAISNSSNLQNFYDEEITGFTQDDWEALLNFYYQVDLNSSCDSGYQVFCRFNSVYKQNVVIKIEQIQNLDYFIILFYDIEIEQSVSTQIKKLVDLMKLEFQTYISYTSGLSVILILIQIICIYLIFLPLFQIIHRSVLFFNHKQNLQPFKQQMYKEKLKIQNIILNKKDTGQDSKKINNVLIKLKIQFDTLFDRVLDQRTSINPQCQILQQFKYPLKNFEYKLGDDLDLQQIRNNYYDQSPTTHKQGKKLKKSFSIKLESL